MKTRLALAVALLGAVGFTVALSVPTASFADEHNRVADVLHAQALYEHVLRLEMGGPNSGPYTAPLHTAPTGDRYLWGGLDPIAALDRYDGDIATDRGKMVFVSRSGSDLGKPTIFLDLPTYPGSPVVNRALFKSVDNRDRFIQMTEAGSLVLAFGLNCGFGVIAGPVHDFAKHSHWAQPGLATIAVERFFGGRLTVLALNLYSRGDDWKATPKRWKYAIQAFESLLKHNEQWQRERSGMPLMKVN